MSAAQRIWLIYFTSTEAFDRTLPGAWSRYNSEVWMPLDIGPSIKFARGALERAKEEAKRLDIPREMLDAAKDWAEPIPYSAAIELLEQL